MRFKNVGIDSRATLWPGRVLFVNEAVSDPFVSDNRAGCCVVGACFRSRSSHHPQECI